MAVLKCAQCGWSEDAEVTLLVKWSIPNRVPVQIGYPLEVMEEKQDKYYLPFCARCLFNSLDEDEGDEWKHGQTKIDDIGTLLR